MVWQNQSFTEHMHSFERLSLDDSAYFVFINADELKVCVQFKKGTLRPWSLWFADSPQTSKQSCSLKHLEPIVKAFGLSVGTLSVACQEQLLTQAAFADQFVREVSETMGPGAVQQSILHTQNFMTNLLEAVERVLGAAQPPHKVTTSVDGAPAAGSEPQRPLLKIVKPSPN